MTGLGALLGLPPEAGPLADLVAETGFVLAAVTTIGLGWMKRAGSHWVPPDEAVPKAVTRVASVVTGVFLVLGYVFLGDGAHTVLLGIISALLAVFAVAALLAVGHLMTLYGFRRERIGLFRRRIAVVKLGGSVLTEEAAGICRDRGVNVDTLFREGHDNANLVWTRESIANVYMKATAAYLSLQLFGSLALGSAGLLLSVATRS